MGVPHEVYIHKRELEGQCNLILTPPDRAGLDDDFRLIVEYENGEREALISGELSVKI